MKRLRLETTATSWRQKQNVNMCPQSFHRIVWLQLNETNKAWVKEEAGEIGCAASMKMSVCMTQRFLTAGLVVCVLKICKYLVSGFRRF